jgi:hypothetical protein
VLLDALLQICLCVLHNTDLVTALFLVAGNKKIDMIDKKTCITMARALS